MNCYGPADLARAFRTVRANTISIAEEIPEDKYSFRPADGCRSVAETLAHVALMPRVAQLIHGTEHLETLVGFDFFGVMSKQKAEQEIPRTKAQLIELLRTEGESFAQFLENVSEQFLAEQVAYPEPMQPRSKSRFEMLSAPKEHEMHHRGQLMLIERLLGITPHLTRQMEERTAQMRAAASR